MSPKSYSLTWDPFLKSIGEGLTTFQQNEDLVDMTLAADGHFVKVHKLIISLASPFLKQLIASAPCPHPVIFLNGVSSQNLSLLLEYIYMGEVVVSSDCLQSFRSLGRSLQLKGLESLPTYPKDEMIVLNSQMDTKSGMKKITFQGTSDKQQVTLPASAKHIKLTNTANQSQLSQVPSLPINNDENMDITLDDSEEHDTIDIIKDEVDLPISQKISTIEDPNTEDKTTVQFTSSNRGSLQIILNRYIYNFTCLKKSIGVKRWRCIDYREKKCLAFVTTKGNVVLSRGNIHNHPFHDKKILDKLDKKAVFSAIHEAERYIDEVDREPPSMNLVEEITGM